MHSGTVLLYSRILLGVEWDIDEYREDSAECSHVSRGREGGGGFTVPKTLQRGSSPKGIFNNLSVI